MDRNHLAVMFHDIVDKHAARVATRIAIGDQWQTRTYAEVGADVRALAACLIARGVEPGDRVLIFSANRPEWTIADFACLTSRAVSVPVFPNSTPEQLRHMINDAGCVVALVSGDSELARIAQVWNDMPSLREVIVFDAVASDDPRVTTLAAAFAEHTDQSPVGQRLEEATQDDLASIIYTSGTTGMPKGVMLTNRGFSFQVGVLNDFFSITPDDHSLCFLPLSHAFERAWTFTVVSNGCMNTFVPDAKAVAEMLVRAKPTLLVSVPRLFEKVYVTAYEKVADSPAKKAIFLWALRVGGHNQHAYRKGRQPSVWWQSQLALADKLVLRNVREAMGGPKKVMACGGAPIRKEIEEFFSACGMLMLQGYGLTEASPLCTFNSHDAFKFGTCGRVVPGGELKIADEGEICYRGPNVMTGYWNQPEATAAVIRDGWLHTGDVGYIDTDGFLVITDRIKDLIITSTGKNIAPAPIESMILADPLFEQAVLLGDNRPYLTLLVSPSVPQLESLGRQLQLTWANRDELLRNPAIVTEVRKRVADLTAKLAKHEQIKDLRLLPDEFTSENGLLTPTLKVRRREVERRFAHFIEDMYARFSPSTTQ